MTNPAVTLPFPPPAPASDVAWITTAQAAMLANETPRNMSRRAALEWMPQGRARLNTWTPGKKEFWEIRTDADPAFAPKPALGPTQVIDAPVASPALLQKAAQRKAILARWDQTVTNAAALNMTKAQATAHFVAAIKREGIKGVSARTLHYWKRDARQGIAGLVDGRSTRHASRQENPFLAEVRHLYEHENGRSFQFCYDHAMLKARELRWEMCSYRAAKRYIDSLNKAELILRREGPKAFNDKCISDIERDYASLRANQVWVADHHQFDVLVKVGERLNTKTGVLEPLYRRPWLTVWMDCRSRKIVGWIVRAEDPNTWAIVEALDRAIESHGLPEVVYTDNGKDFKAKIFTGITDKQARLFKTKNLHVEHDQVKLGGIYATLEIRHMRAVKYHGQSKPVERFFKTVAGRFAPHFDTYCGRSTDERPEGLPDRIERGLAPAFEDFVAGFGQWLEGDYQHKWHGGDAMGDEFPHGPAQAWEATLVSKRTITPRLREVALQPRVGPLTVTKNGVSHLGIGYGKGQLTAHFGRQVFLRIRKDLQTASVWSVDDKEPLGVIDANEKVPFLASQQLAAQAIQEKRRDTRLLKESFESRLRVHETTAQRMQRLVASTAEAQAAAPPAPPADPYTLKPHRSDLEEQLNALQQQENFSFRRAAGAESMSLDAAEAAFSREEF